MCVYVSLSIFALELIVYVCLYIRSMLNNEFNVYVNGVCICVFTCVSLSIFVLCQ